MKIRKAELGDETRIDEIEINSGYRWKESKKEETKNAKNLLKSKNFVYILEDKNKPVGYFALEIKNKIAKLTFLSVIKKYQGKGIGKRLLKYAIKLSKGKTLQTEVWAKNFLAIGLYNKFGFYVVGIKRKDYPHKDDKLVMEKNEKTKDL